MDKSPRNTDVVGRNTCDWKSIAILLKARFCFPFPTQYNVKPQEKLQVVVFNIVCEVGGEARKVKLYSRVACV